MEVEDSRQQIGADDLLSLAREMSDAAAEMRAIRTQSSVVINAGGITSALAICISLTAVVVMMLFAIWLMWQQAEQKSQQEAWIQVWQQRIANELRKDNAN
jgi:hypothetical protein